MTSFLQTIGNDSGQMVENVLATGVALYAYDKILKEKFMSPNDGEWEHLVKQTAVVAGVNFAVDAARQNGWIPNLFGK